MDEQKFNELLYRYIDGELTQEEAGEMEKFLAASPLHKLQVENERKFGTLIKNHLPKEEAPYELREKVIERLQMPGWLDNIFATSRMKKVSIAASVAFAVFLVFAGLSVVTKPFPVFAASVNNHIEYMQGAYPLEIRTNDMDEALKWFEGKLDFAVTRPHLSPERVKFLGARIIHMQGRKAAYFIYEKDGRPISAFVMDLGGIKLSQLAAAKIGENPNNRVYAAAQKGYESVLCYHKHSKTGCIIVTDLPEEELLKLMG